ncbi:MFS transporter [Rhizobium deserti]|uniref:MFS transporter n=1 Tax=Rhizobium deserti TaxID=2547961 RepID=A0A4V3APV0_9HYPH|nr:MFS transporter [Rhizobium deserti]TDK39210.1 MFS transporter [Rhizobium deserti]
MDRNLRRDRAGARESAGPRLTQAVVATASLLSALDLFIVNIAFPSIRDSFHGASNQSLSWVLSAYSIAFAAFMVPGGRMGDRFGRRRLFRTGLIVFLTSSAACALSPDVVWLVAARAFKGLGAALMIPSSLALLLTAYPPDAHKRAIGTWAAIASIGAAAGPILGGLLVHLDWRLIFLINVPVGLPAAWLSRRIGETEAGCSQMPDLLGSASFATGTACIVAAISYSTDWGVYSWRLGILAGGGVALLLVFVRRCLTSPSPALDLRVFRSRPFSLSVAGMLLFYIGFAMSILGGTMYLTQVWRWDPTVAGLAYVVGPAIAGLSSMAAGRARLSPRELILVGCGSFAVASLYWLFNLRDDSQYLLGFLPGSVCSGIAVGTAQAGFLAGGTASLSPREYSAGSGILNTSRQVGGALGVAALVSITGTATSSSDYRLAFIVIACTSLGAGLCAMGLNARGGNGNGKTEASGSAS